MKSSTALFFSNLAEKIWFYRAGMKSILQRYSVHACGFKHVLHRFLKLMMCVWRSRLQTASFLPLLSGCTQQTWTECVFSWRCWHVCPCLWLVLSTEDMLHFIFFLHTIVIAGKCSVFLSCSVWLFFFPVYGTLDTTCENCGKCLLIQVDARYNRWLWHRLITIILPDEEFLL